MLRWWHALLFSVVLGLLVLGGVAQYHRRPYATADLPALPVSETAEQTAATEAAGTEAGAAASEGAATEGAATGTGETTTPPSEFAPAPAAQPELPPIPEPNTGLGPEGLTSTGGSSEVSSTGGRVGGGMGLGGTAEVAP